MNVMKFYKYILLFSTALVFCTTTPAQAPDARNLLKDGSHLYGKLDKYIRTNGKELLERECANGCFFLKFSIDSKGNIIDLVSNNWAWPLLDTLVQSALLSTNGQWIAPKKGSKSKTYFLPVKYSTGNCRPITSLDELMASMPSPFNDSAIVKSMQKGMGSNFMHMNDFENKSEKLPRRGTNVIIECFLLPPLELSAPKV